MSMRSFFLWFWGLVFGGGVAASAALALLQAPAESKAPAVQPVALTEPLPLPPVPAIAEAQHLQPSARLHPHAAFARLWRVLSRPRHAPELAANTRITVVPPVPPRPAPASPAREVFAHPSHVPTLLRAPVRAEPKPAAIPSGAPVAEARAYAYRYARNYPRGGYYTYTYTYPYSYYPYPYYYSYQY